MSNPFDGIEDTRVQTQPIPCWAIACTRTGQLVDWSDSLRAEVEAVGFDACEVLCEVVDWTAYSWGLLLFEGTIDGVVVGTSDLDDGPEYEAQCTGTWRELTAEEAVALAAGSFRPGIGSEVYNQGSFGKHMMGQLKAMIDAHGPITRQNQSSAHKRLLGAIRDWNNRHP